MNTKLKKELQKVKEKDEQPFISSLESAKTLLIGYSREQDQILKDAGLSSTRPAESTITEEYKRVKAAEQVYKTESFTGAQIKSLCNKYDLRMLPTKKYKGIVPADTANHIKEFCDRNKFAISDRQLFILAPTEMFGTDKVSTYGTSDLMLFYRTYESDASKAKAKEQDIFNQIYNWGSDFPENRKYWFLLDAFVHKENIFSNMGKLTTLSLSITLFLLFIILNIPSMIILSSIALFISVIIFAQTKIYTLKNDEQWNSDETYC